MTDAFRPFMGEVDPDDTAGNAIFALIENHIDRHHQATRDKGWPDGEADLVISILSTFLDLAYREPWLATWVRESLHLGVPLETRQQMLESLTNVISRLRADVTLQQNAVRILTGEPHDEWSGPILGKDVQSTLTPDELSLLTAVGTAWRVQLKDVLVTRGLNGIQLLRVIQIISAGLAFDVVDMVTTDVPADDRPSARDTTAALFVTGLLDELQQFGLDVFLAEPEEEDPE